MDRFSLGIMVAKLNAEEILRQKISKIIESFTEIECHKFASQRTSADQIEHDARQTLLESDQQFKPPSGPRQPGDIRYIESHTFHINIKSLDLDRDFHMPNIISSENLWKILDSGDDFMILKFHHSNGKIQSWEFWNIQDISWDCLQIGALGTGQIQLKNGVSISKSMHQDRADWRRQWKDIMLKFYNREQIKIDRRIQKWQKR